MKQGELFGEVPPPRAPAPVPAACAIGAPRDAAARRTAVSEFTRPLMLEAGAGTGKTATLVARVVHWCLGPGWDEAARERDGAPEETAVLVLRGVAAITFTEAAAAEMSTRVGQALARLQRLAAAGTLDAAAIPKGLRAEALPAAAELLARARALRAALDHLNVSTIHAFCRRLLATHPLAVGFDPAFEVDATFHQLELVVRQTLEAHLREAWSEPVDPDLVALARAGVDPPKIERALVDLVEQGARAADFAADPLDAATCARLRAELEEAVETLWTAAAPLAGLKDTTVIAMTALSDTRPVLAAAPEEPRTAFDALRAGLHAVWEEQPKALQRLRKWARSANPFGKREETALGEGVAAFPALAERCLRALQPFLEVDPELLDRVRRVVGARLAAVEAELRRRGVATFADLLVEARRMLVEHPEIAAIERRRLRQLLVDEFQDTDEVQCDIVGALGLDGPPAERPGLFLVGDPKQSIFAWRNADLLAYDEFEERVVAAGGEVLRLASNFRSRAAVLDEVARVIAPVMEEARGVQPPFVPLDAGRPDAGELSSAPRIEHWCSWTTDADGALEPFPKGPGGPPVAESYALEGAAIARDVVERHAVGARWGDFAVLFRALTDVEPYLLELRRRGVPYEVASERKYFQRREVVDATALARAVLDPHDQLALVATLRAPFVGMPDAALLPLWEAELPSDLARLTGPDPARLEAIAAKVCAVAARLPTDVPGLAEIGGWERSVVAAIEAIARAREAFRREPADRFVERLRDLLAPEAVEAARFLGAYRLVNLERFFRELLAALEERAGDVHSVLRTLRANLAREDRTEASRPSDSGADAVKILTIHGAKGLEFDTVYLAQAHKKPRVKNDDETAFDRRGGAVAWRLFGTPTPSWFAATERRELAERAERVRLLYVALTRAKERLVVLGGWGDPSAERKRWDRAQTFVDLLECRPGAAETIAELAARARAGDHAPLVDETGALWRVALAPDDAEVARAGHPGRAAGAPAATLPRPTVAAAEREVAELAAARARAATRSARPVSRAASAEAHAGTLEARATRRFAEGEAGAEALAEPRRPRRRDGELTLDADLARDAGGASAISRAAAQAAGTAVHRVLERLDLAAADVRAELGRTCARLPELVADLRAPTDRAAALERARLLCAELAENGLVEKLRALRERVVARELSVLLPASADEHGAAEPATDDADPTAPVGFVAGAIDLVYRGEDGALVVADYKTDDVSSDAEIAARAAGYASQGRAYVAALQQALALPEPPRFELWFLRAGRVVSA